MGEAKNKGSFEQRRENARGARTDSREEFAERLSVAVDSTVLLELFYLYAATVAKLRVNGQPQETHLILGRFEEVFNATNAASAHAARVVADELKKRDIKEPTGYIARLLASGEVIKAPQYAEFVKIDGSGASVSPALVRALASAKLIVKSMPDKDYIGFDFDHVQVNLTAKPQPEPVQKGILGILSRILGRSKRVETAV